MQRPEEGTAQAMDADRLKQRVLRRLVVAPSVVVPPVLGALGALGWLVAGAAPVLAGFVAVGGFSVGLGMLTNRWLFKTDAISRSEFDRMRAEERRTEDRALDELEAALVEDRDPRTEDALRSLRHAHASLHEQLGEGDRAALIDVGRQAQELFASAVASLRRSLDLVRTASAMSTYEGRAGILAEREQLIGEIQASSDQLRRTLDAVRSLGSSGETGRLSSIRQELDRSLEVARRVESRLRSFSDPVGELPERE